MKTPLIICIAVLAIAVLASGCLDNTPNENNSDNAYRLEVLKSLSASGAKLYVTPATCPHCRHQEEILGAGAGDYIEIIDCAKGGDCEGIQYVPTWIINGKTYIGVYELKELAELEQNGTEQKSTEGTTPLE